MPANSPPTTVYLDLNFWIGFAQVRAGQRQGDRHQPLLERLEQRVASGDIVVPLSSAHYLEMYRIRDPNQRRAVATVMLQLSRHCTLVDRSLLVKHALRRALAKEFDVPYEAPGPSLLGFGLGHAFEGRAIVGRIQGGSPEERDELIVERGSGMVKEIANTLRYPFPEETPRLDFGRVLCIDVVHHRIRTSQGS